MFAKLLKYEWKSTSAILGILSLCALGAGLLGGGAQRLTLFCREQMVTGNTQFAILLMLSTLLMAGAFLTIMAYAVGTNIMLYYRFFKSRFTDEGYLTFTLPVTAAQVFWSSFLVLLAWSVISGIVTVLAVGAISVLGYMGTEAQLTLENLKQLFFVLDILFEEATAEAIVAILVSVVSSLASIVYFMTAITVGSIIAKKHKLLAAIGVYIGASMVMGMVTGTLSAFTMIFSYATAANAIIFVYVLQILFSLAMASGACALNIYLMKNKLNLP